MPGWLGRHGNGAARLSGMGSAPGSGRYSACGSEGRQAMKLRDFVWGFVFGLIIAAWL
jgi:hypothetical protein